MRMNKDVQKKYSKSAHDARIKEKTSVPQGGAGEVFQKRARRTHKGENFDSHKETSVNNSYDHNDRNNSCDNTIDEL